MDDKCIMENLLNVTKGVCDLYMHGSIESSSPNVHRAFTDALNEALSMQSSIYREMSVQSGNKVACLRLYPQGLYCQYRKVFRLNSM